MTHAATSRAALPLRRFHTASASCGLHLLVVLEPDHVADPGDGEEEEHDQEEGRGAEPAVDEPAEAGEDRRRRRELEGARERLDRTRCSALAAREDPLAPPSEGRLRSAARETFRNLNPGFRGRKLRERLRKARRTLVGAPAGRPSRLGDARRPRGRGRAGAGRPGPGATGGPRGAAPCRGRRRGRRRRTGTDAVAAVGVHRPQGEAGEDRRPRPQDQHRPALAVARAA